MNQSAIWKIEHAGRKITLDEAVAFGRVFNMTLDEPLVPPEMADDEWTFELIATCQEQYAAAKRALGQVAETAAALDALLHEHPEMKDRVVESLARSPRGGREAREILERDDLAGPDRWHAMFDATGWHVPRPPAASGDLKDVGEQKD